MVNVIISSDSRYQVNKKSIEETIIDLLKLRNVTGEVEVEVTVVGDRKMLELNKKYRNLNETTDVLSFCFEENVKSDAGFIASPDNTLRLGSIVISYPQAIEDASNDGKTVEQEINFLVMHGLNHLLGIHHE